MAHFCPQELDFSLRRHLEDLGETQELWDGWSKPESQGAETVGIALGAMLGTKNFISYLRGACI